MGPCEDPGINKLKLIEPKLYMNSSLQFKNNFCIDTEFIKMATKAQSTLLGKCIKIILDTTEPFEGELAVIVY